AQQAQASLQIEALSTGMGGLHGGVEAARTAFQDVEGGLQAARDGVRQIERRHQEAEYQVKTISNRIIDIDSSIEVISETLGRLSTAAEALEAEIAGTDEGTLQSQLQVQLDGRVQREEALKLARDELEGADARLRETEQERLASEQKLNPMRERIND